GKEKRNGEPEYIFLCIPGILTRQILLHDILIEPIHGNGNKDPGNKGFEEVPVRSPAPFKYLRHITFSYHCNSFSQAEVQVGGDQVNTHHHGSKEEKGLKGIGINDGLDPSTEGVKPDEQ